MTFVGMLLNVVLSLVKGFFGLVSGSQALMADAVHSISDLVTDLAVILGVKYWEAPADDEHPYGHGKIQALVTLFIAAMLFLVAWRLIVNAVGAFFDDSHGTPGLVASLAAVVSVIVKELLYQWTARVARKINSHALMANAWHHRSDAISSAPVAVAVTLAYFFPSLWWADPLCALLVAGFILMMVWEIMRPSLQELTDAVIDSKSDAVAKVALSVEGVKSVHQCRARRYGAAFQADLHVQVDASLSIVEAHSLGHKVKDCIIDAGIDVCDAIIHVEPYRE